METKMKTKEKEVGATINHTPTPWKLENTRPNYPSTDPDNRALIVPCDPSLGTKIAVMQYHDRQLAYHDAAFIVTACNAHDDLVLAAKAAAELLEACKRAEYFFQQITDTYKGPNYAEAFKALSSAITKAEGEHV
jgi:hypothetical protein